jgi:hypothetical protein
MLKAILLLGLFLTLVNAYRLEDAEQSSELVAEISAIRNALRRRALDDGETHTELSANEIRKQAWCVNGCLGGGAFFSSCASGCFK